MHAVVYRGTTLVAAIGGQLELIRSTLQHPVEREYINGQTAAGLLRIAAAISLVRSASGAAVAGAVLTHDGKVISLIVDSAYRGQGWAGRIIDSLIAEAARPLRAVVRVLPCGALNTASAYALSSRTFVPIAVEKYPRIGNESDAHLTVEQDGCYRALVMERM